MNSARTKSNKPRKALKRNAEGVRKNRRLIRYARTVEILVERPSSYQELLNSAKEYKSFNGLISYVRHTLTNYEKIGKSFYHMFSCTYEDRLEAMEILRDRVNNIAYKLIKELQEQDNCD
jgi:hypothetical protein